MVNEANKESVSMKNNNELHRGFFDNKFRISAQLLCCKYDFLESWTTNANKEFRS